MSSIIRRVVAAASRAWVRGLDRQPLERSTVVQRLNKQVREIARELGYQLSEGRTGGGSDGGLTSALVAGLPASVE